MDPLTRDKRVCLVHGHICIVNNSTHTYYAPVRYKLATLTLETLISFVLGGLLVLLIVLVLVAIFRRLSRGQDDTTTRGVAGESLGIECFVRVPIRVAVRSLGENQPSQPLLQLTIRNGPQPTEVVPLKPNKEA